MLVAVRQCVRRAGSKNYDYYFRNRALVAERKSQRPYDHVAVPEGQASPDRPVVRITLAGNRGLSCTFHAEVASDASPAVADHFLKLCEGKYPNGYIGSPVESPRPSFSVQWGNLHKPFLAALDGKAPRGDPQDADAKTEAAPVVTPDMHPPPLLNRGDTGRGGSLRHSQPGVITMLPVMGHSDLISPQVALALDPAPHLDATCEPVGAVVGDISHVRAFAVEAAKTGGAVVEAAEIVSADTGAELRRAAEAERERVLVEENAKAEAEEAEAFEAAFPPLRGAGGKKKKGGKKGKKGGR